MEDQFSRQRMLIGEEGMRILNGSRVAVFGLGGVGGYAVEALARCGIGAIDLVDHDRFSLTNLNRQLHATHSTLGMLKTDAVRNRILEINPDCRVTVYPVFFLPDNAADFNLSLFSYVVDAMDTVTAKLALARSASDAGVPLISAMGTGNKTDPTALHVSSIEQTSVCPLARIMRKECRKRGITGLKAVWSSEDPLSPLEKPPQSDAGDSLLPRRDTPGSFAFVPAAAGLLLASRVVLDLLDSAR
jgi:tRNA A37 threonylcarbamoyladenosine dehydratase